MATLNDSIPTLPCRIWDLDSESMRKMGAVRDYDTEAHATAEWLQDAQASKQLVADLGLNAGCEMKLMTALRGRHRVVWGRHSHACAPQTSGSAPRAATVP